MKVTGAGAGNRCGCDEAWVRSGGLDDRGEELGVSEKGLVNSNAESKCLGLGKTPSLRYIPSRRLEFGVFPKL